MDSSKDKVGDGGLSGPEGTALGADSRATLGIVEYVREHAFEVGPRYTSLAYIGEGAYGMVV